MRLRGSLQEWGIEYLRNRKKSVQYLLIMAINRIIGYNDLSADFQKRPEGELVRLMEELEALERGLSTLPDGAELARIRQHISEMVEELVWTDTPLAQEILEVIAPISQTGNLDREMLPRIHQKLAMVELMYAERPYVVPRMQKSPTKNTAPTSSMHENEMMRYPDLLASMHDFFIHSTHNFLMAPHAQDRMHLLIKSMQELILEMPEDPAWDEARSCVQRCIDAGESISPADVASARDVVRKAMDAWGVQ